MVATICAASLLAAVPQSAPAEPFKVLVFSKTAGFRHDSIETGVETIRGLGKDMGVGVEETEDSARFTDEGLGGFAVVVFLNTTGDVLDASGEAALQRFVRKGGGFVGIHAAADTEYGWPWYGELVGAWFRSHPAIQKATLKVVDRTHPSTKHLGETWVRTDEWYDYRALPPAGVKVLLRLDTSTYTGHVMGDDHPIAWFREFEGGRAFYTGGGHTKESYKEPEFQQHLLGAILWAAGKSRAAVRAVPQAAGALPAQELLGAVAGKPANRGYSAAFCG